MLTKSIRDGNIFVATKVICTYLILLFLMVVYFRNLYNRVLNDEDRTNNHAGAVNRRLNTERGVQHKIKSNF